MTDVVRIEFKPSEAEQLRNIVAQARRVAQAKLEQCQLSRSQAGACSFARSAHEVNIKFHREVVNRMAIIEELIERAQLST